MNEQKDPPLETGRAAGEPAHNVAFMLPPEECVPFGEIERQFTRYLRDPANSPLPPGTDELRMRHYVRQFRGKLFFLLQCRAAGLTRALGDDRVHELLNDFVRRPLVARSGKSSFEEAFFDWLKEEWASRSLPPWLPDLVDYCRTAIQMESLPATSQPDQTSECDLLAGVPVFSELARLLRFEWPVHRIGEDFVPDHKPRDPTWLVVNRNRQGEGTYVELNRQAAAIAVLVRNNDAGRTGAEILADAGTDMPFVEPAAALRDGLAVLESLRKRDIILCLRAPD